MPETSEKRLLVLVLKLNLVTSLPFSTVLSVLVNFSFSESAVEVGLLEYCWTPSSDLLQEACYPYSFLPNIRKDGIGKTLFSSFF